MALDNTVQFSLQDTWYRIQYTRYKIQDTRYRIHGAGYRILALDTGYGIQPRGGNSYVIISTLTSNNYPDIQITEISILGRIAVSNETGNNPRTYCGTTAVVAYKL